MVEWTTVVFECADEGDRASLMDWFEANHPVTFPENRYSTFAAIETDDGEPGADFAWVDRYLYVTVMGEPGGILGDTRGRWERAASGTFDGSTESLVKGMLFDATEAADDEAATAEILDGQPEWAGIGVMYALAMLHQFRFRTYAAQSPTNQLTPHPHAFTVPTEFATDFDEFVEEMAEVTGVEPTDAGLEYLKDDPADDERYAYGETYDPAARDGGGIDAVTVVDARDGTVERYEDPEDVEEAVGDSAGRTVLGRIKSLLGG